MQYAEARRKLRPNALATEKSRYIMITVAVTGMIISEGSPSRDATCRYGVLFITAVPCVCLLL